MEGHLPVAALAVYRSKPAMTGEPLQHFHNVRKWVAVRWGGLVYLAVVNHRSWLCFLLAAICFSPYYEGRGGPAATRRGYHSTLELSRYSFLHHTPLYLSQLVCPLLDWRTVPCINPHRLSIGSLLQVLLVYAKHITDL